MTAHDPAMAMVDQMMPPERPAEAVLLPHRHQRENNAGYAQEYNQPQTYCKAMIVSVAFAAPTVPVPVIIRYLLNDALGEPLIPVDILAAPR
jgi:hypothetical protein